MNAELEIHGPHFTSLQALGIIGAYIVVGIVMTGLLCRFLGWRFNDDDGDETAALCAMVMFWPMILLFAICAVIGKVLRALVAAIAGWDYERSI